MKEYCLSVVPHEKNRIDRIREKFNHAIQDFLQNGKVDQNRLEQEIIFYLEKLRYYRREKQTCCITATTLWRCLQDDSM
jgi:hypothetical protein